MLSNAQQSSDDSGYYMLSMITKLQKEDKKELER